MAHRRKPLGVALALNSAVLAIEATTGVRTNSLALVIDSVHNLSDELGLALLFLAYTLPAGLSGALLRSANFFNSIGLLAISGFLAWRSIERLTAPPPVIGLGPVLAGLIGVVGNWGVARALRGAAERDAAIRLAYVHNLGDVLLSFAPVAAGLLILVSGRPLFDPLIALGLAVAIAVTTVRELARGGEALLWPPTLSCGHSEVEEDASDAFTRGSRARADA
jgi:cobalt-zinc-cadmium efflux system protein